MSGCQKQQQTRPPEKALQAAQELYAQAVDADADLSSGPCLSNGLFSGVSPEDQWVVDIVHAPRLDIDNLPANQCAAYRNGEAKHFIELDLDGKLIKFF